MPESFGDAALRHWSDASLLEQAERMPNADQLFGFAAECALKVALTQHPTLIVDGELHGRYREHINILWDRVPIQSLHRRFAGLVAVLKALNNPFADWNVNQRYATDAAIVEEAKTRHRDAARRVLGAVALNGTRQGA